MGTASFVQGDFRGGEWSPTAQGNLADPRYKTAMAVCRNAVPTETGAWTRRPGTRHAGRSKTGLPARVIRFTFVESNPYTIEFTDGFLRFYDGHSIATTNDDNTVSSVSTANPAVVTTATAHGWNTGDTIFFNFGDTTAPLLQGRRFVITVLTSTTFSIVSEVTGTSIDGSAVAWSSPGVAVGVSRIYELASPYSQADWSILRAVQADNAMIFFAPSKSPRILQVTTQPDSGSFASFSLSTLTFVDGPYLDPPTNGLRVTPSGLSGSINLTFSFQAYSATQNYNTGDYVTSSSSNYVSLIDNNLNNTPASSPTAWQLVTAANILSTIGLSGADIGRQVRILSEPPDWATGTTYAIGNVVKYANAYWMALAAMSGSTPSTGSINPNTPGVKATQWAPTSGASVATWTWGTVTGFSNSISGGTNIGNMTAKGGLAAAFDGNTNQGFLASASNNGTLLVGWSVYGYGQVGKNYTGSAKAVAQAVVYPSIDKGFGDSTGGIASLIQLTLMASNFAPTLGNSDSTSQGTILAQSAVMDNSTKPVLLISSNSSSTWNYVWVQIKVHHNNASATDGSWRNFCAEVRLYAPLTGGAGDGLIVSIEGPALLYTNAAPIWRLGLFGGGLGYPSCGTYHEGRLWLSGSQPNRIDACQSNGISGTTVQMMPTAADGTVTDANAIDYTFNAPDSNPIFWMQPDHQGIICGTQAGEWLIQATANNNILTPTSIQAHRVTRVGCANIEPVRAPLTVLYVQRHLRKLQEYFADVFSGKFTSPDLTAEAKHLTASQFAEIDFQNDIWPVLWARMADGTLLGMSYRRDSLMSSQGPNVKGWHRHDLGSGRIVEYARVAGNSDGTLDTLAMVTSPSTDPVEVRHIEIMEPFFEDGAAGIDAWFLDDAIAATSYSADGSGVTANGFWAHNGNTVTVFAGGLDVGDFVVTNGSITLPFAGLFTSAFVAGFSGAMTIIAGYTFTSDGQLLRPDTQPESGSRSGPALGMERRIAQYAAWLINTQGMKIGTNFDNLKTVMLRSDGGSLTRAANDLFTGVVQDTLQDGQAAKYTSQICWRFTRPYPATVGSIAGFIHTSDR